MNGARIFAIWLGRVVANAVAGGLAFSVMGAFCGGIAGAMFGVIIAPIGAIVGVACGIAGFLVHLIAAMGAEPGEFWQPFYDLTPRVAFGQLWVTIAAITSFFAFELVDSQLQGASFRRTVDEDAFLFFVFAPALMILGAIASAVLKRD